MSETRMYYSFILRAEVAKLKRFGAIFYSKKKAKFFKLHQIEELCKKKASNKPSNRDLFYNLFSSKCRKYQFQLEIEFQFILKFPLIMFFFAVTAINVLKL